MFDFSHFSIIVKVDLKRKMFYIELNYLGLQILLHVVCCIQNVKGCKFHFHTITSFHKQSMAFIKFKTTFF